MHTLGYECPIIKSKKKKKEIEPMRARVLYQINPRAFILPIRILHFNFTSIVPFVRSFLFSSPPTAPIFTFAFRHHVFKARVEQQQAN